jgi:23S rRNA U2552 (ribose-2'-O)-methylase RlmE/FtsJ
VDYAAGRYYIQEASTMLSVAAATRVEDFSEKRVLDLCAAPGGKATQAAETAGLLVANEVIQSRIPPVTWNLVRHRAANSIVTNLDPGLLASLLPGWFDVVLVDAPCSGEGLLARGKLNLHDWNLKNVLFCAERQRSILRKAVELLAPDGLLVYSTCTFAPEENELNTRFLLNLGLLPEPFPADIPASEAVGDDAAVLSCSRRLYPHRNGGAGAYVSLLRKPDDAKPGCTPRGIKFAKVRRSLPLIEKPEEGRIFEHRGIIRYWTGEGSLPAILADKSLETGLPLYREPSGWMHGAVGLAKPEFYLPLEPQAIQEYLQGRDMPFSVPDNWYVTAVDNTPIGLIKVSGGRGVNRFPESLRIK